jgi:nucleotide-binding universal stress UspA family protein
VLIPVADPRSGRSLLQLADLLTAPPRPAHGASPPPASSAVVDRQAQLGLSPAAAAALVVDGNASSRKIYALHLRRPAEQDAYSAAASGSSGASASPETRPPAELSLQPLLEYGDQAGIPVETIAFVSRDVADDIVRTAIDRDVDLVLMGSHRPLVGRAVLGGAVRKVLAESPADVAVLLERGLMEIRRILVPYLGSKHDRLALDLASRLGRAGGASVTVLHVVSRTDSETDVGAVQDVFTNKDPSQPAPVEFRVVRGAEPVDAVLAEAGGFDLMIVGVDEPWGLESHLFALKRERLVAESACSLLLVRKGEAIVAPAGAESQHIAGTHEAGGTSALTRASANTG